MSDDLYSDDVLDDRCKGARLPGERVEFDVPPDLFRPLSIGDMRRCGFPVMEYDGMDMSSANALE